MKNLITPRLAMVLCGLGLWLILAGIHPAKANGPWYVGPNGSDSNDCLSPSTACQTIHVAIGRASDGETVIILPGTYSSATGNIFPINVPDGIKVEGSGHETTILVGDSDKAVIYIGSSTENIFSDTEVSDLTLKDGNIGLEIYASKSKTVSPTLSNLLITENTTGIKITTGKVYENGATISAVISNTQVLSNAQNGIYMQGYGYFSKGQVEPVIIDSLIQNNGTFGIYMTADAPGSNGSYSAPELIRTQITGNGDHGIYAKGSYEGWIKAVIAQSVITNNGGYGFYWGQGANRGNIDTDIINTVIAENEEGGVSIGMKSEYSGASHLDIINSTIRDNQNYGIYWDRVDPNYEEVTPTVLNTIVWNPFADDLFSTGNAWTTTQITYSDIEDGDWNGVDGNFSAEPEFFDDIHQSACSPTINAGMLAAGTPLYDIDGDSRVEGNPPDVGADEFPGYFCLLSTNMRVSSDSAKIGDTLFYTITLTNTTEITPAVVALTDVLPPSLVLESNHLEQTGSEQGLQQAGGNVFQWNGTIMPATTQTIYFQARAASSDDGATHYASITTEDGGLYRTPDVTTAIELIKVFLPAIFTQEPPPPPPPALGIFGQVTHSGNPAAGISLELRFYNGSAWSTLANTVTASDGSFRFSDVPTLESNQAYYVRYFNAAGTPGNLFLWATKTLETYTTGTDVEIGNFDIADLVLLTPSSGATVALPYTFTWTPRPATPTDSYEFDIYDPVDLDPYAYTDPPLGYVGGIIIYGLPPGFTSGTTYVWEIWIYSPDGGIGISLEARPVAFSDLNITDFTAPDPLVLMSREKWLNQDLPLR